MPLPLNFYPDYKIAAGWNNAAGFVTVESMIAATETRYMMAPTVRDGYSPGAVYIRGDGTGGYQGFASVRWHWDMMTYLNEVYLRTTATAGAYNGMVTVRTRLTATGAFANYNAVIFFPPPVESNESRLYRIEPYEVALARMVAI